MHNLFVFKGNALLIYFKIKNNRKRNKAYTEYLTRQFRKQCHEV